MGDSLISFFLSYFLTYRPLLLILGDSTSVLFQHFRSELGSRSFGNDAVHQRYGKEPPATDSDDTNRVIHASLYAETSEIVARTSPARIARAKEIIQKRRTRHVR